MTWTPPTTRIPTTMPRITFTFSDRLAVGEQPASQSANYQLVILDQYGRPYKYDQDTGDMIPHMTTEERDTMLALVATWRARAETQILGE